MKAEISIDKFKKIDRCTARAVAFWLNPSLRLEHSLTWDTLVSDLTSIDTAIFQECGKNLDYKQFLTTPYWHTVSRFVKKRDKYTCRQCKRAPEPNPIVPIELHVHHENYHNRGLDHKFTDDLITVCSLCHALKHGLLAEALFSYFATELHFAKKPFTPGAPRSMTTDIQWLSERVIKQPRGFPSYEL